MHPDVIVIGGGMAGASVAHDLASDRRVLLLEREAQPGYHTTGRSAALYIRAYGNEAIRALTLASREFYFNTPAWFSDTPLLSPRGEMFVARTDQLDDLDRTVEAVRPFVPTIQRLNAAETRELCPSLRPGHIEGAMYEDDAQDMDVAAILHGYLRGLKGRGGVLRTGADVTKLERQGGVWEVATTAGTFRAPVVVNASGAWGDVIAHLAGVPPIGLQPKRRTAFLIAPPPGSASASWPGISDIGEKWYFKPDAGKLLCSPADETPSEPCDAWPDDMDVAVAVDRIQQALDIEVTHVGHSWAGLRSFAPDRTPVSGFEPTTEGFYWLVGQGGYGIQTAPAMADLAARQIRGEAWSMPAGAPAFDPVVLSPARFRA